MPKWLHVIIIIIIVIIIIIIIIIIIKQVRVSTRARKVRKARGHVRHAI